VRVQPLDEPLRVGVLYLTYQPQQSWSQ
jgi:hypothetical protein